MFFDLAAEFHNLVGFKEFGGRESLSYAAEHITSQRDDLDLVVGVDTQVVHGIVHCGATGVITGVGNALPAETLRLVELARLAAEGDPEALVLPMNWMPRSPCSPVSTKVRTWSCSTRHLMVLEGNPQYAQSHNPNDELSGPQRAFVEQAWQRFRRWWERWPGAACP